jgi:hypothetical protein
MMGIESHRLPYHSNGFLRLPRIDQDKPHPGIAISIVGIEGNGPLSLSKGLLVLFFVE